MMMIYFHFWIPLMWNHMMKNIQFFNSHQNKEHLWTLYNIIHTLTVVVTNKFWLDIILTKINSCRTIKKWQVGEITKLRNKLNTAFNYAVMQPNTHVISFFLFFWSGLRGPKVYSWWGGVVPSPSIGYDYL